jgi:aminoglycoside phosphotransferase family enzyme/predicted kinase
MLAARANEARGSVAAARRLCSVDRGRQHGAREARAGCLCDRSFDVSPHALTRSVVEPGELRTAIARLVFPGGDAGLVGVRETHISWVFLAGQRAYKLKKPLVLPFLDYGTPARRRQMCLEEVRLNRRLAADVYLGVRGLIRTPVGLELAEESDPRAVDYVVEMRRYDEKRTLAAMLGRGEVPRPAVAQVAQTLAKFHAACPAREGQFGARTVDREIDRNIGELLGVAELRADRDQIHRLSRLLTAYVESHSDGLDARAARGLTREGHGDLRAEHVVLERHPCIVDCVEFDVSLRTLDVADDLAFLVMDLAALGRERLGSELVEAYRDAGGDCGDDSLLAFFAVHRALVRAKVLFLRALQTPIHSAAHGRASAQGRELLVVAQRFAWRARLPLVIVICGVPASGKSHLAAALATASGLPQLSSDLVRKRLAGIEPTQPAAAAHYIEEFNRATYAELGRLAASEALAHGGALVDATFRHRRDRDTFTHAFANRAPLLLVECLTPASVLAERAAQRELDPSRVSDATLSVVLSEHLTWEPLEEVQGDWHVTLRTDRPLARILADLIALLDQRLS